MHSDDMREEAYLKQMESGALLNPRVDSTFKALFTRPTKESRAALHAFLEAALEQKIQDVVLTANDAPAGYDRQRGCSRMSGQWRRTHPLRWT